MIGLRRRQVVDTTISRSLRSWQTLRPESESREGLIILALVALGAVH
jgi:hypothetical protein